MEGCELLLPADDLEDHPAGDGDRGREEGKLNRLATYRLAGSKAAADSRSRMEPRTP